MKKSLFTLLFLLSSVSAFAAKGDVTPNVNECSAVMDSKVYLSSNFHGYPREVSFECTYKCNANGRIDTLTGTSHVRVGSMEDDALSPVCQGVTLKKVPWGYEFDKIVPFYAPMTKILEIKSWVFQNIDFNLQTNPLEQEKLVALKNDLYKVSSSFIAAGVSGGESTAHFKEAGYKISAIADELPGSSNLLDEVIKQIVENKGSFGYAGSDALVMTMIMGSASWRVPTHLFK